MKSIQTLQIVSNQISLLVSELSLESFEKNQEQIEYLCTKYPKVYKNYLGQLVLFSLLDSDNFCKESLISKLLSQEIAKNLSKSGQIWNYRHLFVPVLNSSTFEKFCHCLHLNKVQQFQLAICCSDLVDTEAVNRDLKSFIESNLELFDQIDSDFYSSVISENKSLLEIFAKTSKFITKNPKLLEKMASDTSVSPLTLLQTPGQRLSADYLATILPKVDSSKIEEVLAIIFAEILLPGSQLLANGGQNLTALTPMTMESASSVGYQIRLILTNTLVQTPPAKQLVPKILDLIKDKTDDPTLVSLNQFVSALPSEEYFDVFLSLVSPMPKLVTSLYVLMHSFTTENRCYQFMSLQSSFDNVTNVHPSFFANSGNSIFRFLNIARLYVDVFCAGPADHIGPDIAELMKNDTKLVPECFIFALLNLDQNSARNELLDNLLILAVQANQVFVPVAFKHYMETRPANFKKFLTTVASFAEPAPTKVALASQQAGILESLLITDTNAIDFEVWLQFAVMAARHGWTRLAPCLRSYFGSVDAKVASKNLDLVVYFLLNEAKNEYELIQSGQREANNQILSLSVVHELITVVGEQKNLSAKQLLEVTNMKKQCLSSFPRLINFGTGHDEAILANVVPASPNTFPLQVEQQMKTYYQRMYHDGMSITEIVHMLQRLKNSNLPYEQDVFACMIHSLLDEYRFFSEYPVDALSKTSILFGSLVSYRLVEGIALQIALSYILDSAREAPESNMFKFAVQALIQAGNRLGEFPVYCKALYEIENLKHHPKVYEMIGNLVKQNELNDDSTENLQECAFKSVRPLRKLNAINEPPVEVKDKLLFIVNNATEESLSQRLGLVKQALSEQYHLWFAHYLVASRAKSEPNYQDLYSSLVFGIDRERLQSDVFKVTYQQISSILNKCVSQELSSNERGFVKNLGSWLGKISLAHDLPILRENISIKDLLFEGYIMDKLSVIVPFVCKILAQTPASKVFKLPNPWTLGVLQVLKEFYDVADLKLQLKFEIEVLANTLEVDLKDIEATNYLADGVEGAKKLLEKELCIGEAAVKVPTNTTSVTVTRAVPGSTAASVAGQVPPGAAPVAIGPVPGGLQNTNTAAEQISLQHQFQQQLKLRQQQQQRNDVANMVESFVASLHGAAFDQAHPALKRILQDSFGKAIREGLPVIVDKATKISVNTALTLVVKDFALESDENKLRRSAISSVRGISKALANMFSKEVLLKHVGDNVASSLHTLRADPSVVEQTLIQIINDNFEGACALVEFVAMEKATVEIVEALIPQVLSRRQHRLENPGVHYVSPNLSQYSLYLPHPLGLSAQGVTSEQMAVYEDLEVRRPPGAVPPGQSGAVPGALGVSGAPGVPPGVAGFAGGVPAAPGVMSGSVGPVDEEETRMQSIGFLQQLLEMFMKELSQTTDAVPFAALPPSHPVKSLIAEIVACCKRVSPGSDDIYVKVAQFTVNALLTSSDSQVSSETLVYLLHELCVLSPSTAKVSSWWLVHAEDDRKFNPHIMAKLLQVGLVNAVDLDNAMAKSVNSGNELALKFAQELCQMAVFQNPPFALRCDFAETLASLKKFKDVDLTKPLDVPKNTKATMNSYMSYVFMEYLRLAEHNSRDEKLHYVFVYQLATKVLNTPEKCAIFFRIATMLAIEIVENPLILNDSNNCWAGVDALAKLVLQLVVCDTENKIDWVQKFMSICVLCLSKDHELKKDKFNEIPYFRIFSSLLSEWCSLRAHLTSMKNAKEVEHLKNFDSEFYMLLADFWIILQPLAFPGMTFAWLTIVSHRFFLPHFLEMKEKSWPKLNNLLLAALKFCSVNLSKNTGSGNVPPIIAVVYRGLIRIFSSIAHDFPEYFVANANLLVPMIPLQFVQLRNIVLSAVPKNMELPSPFAPNCYEKLNHVSFEAPALGSLKKPVENYLRIPSNTAFKSILSGIKLHESLAIGGIGFEDCNFNLKLINNLVEAVTNSAVQEEAHCDNKSSQIGLLHALLNEDSCELKYHLVSAIVNQLRLNTAETQWNSKVVLHLFKSAKISNLQEIILRVLLERLISNKPHPWGLSQVFAQLVKENEKELDQFGQIGQEFKNIFDSLKKYVK